MGTTEIHKFKVVGMSCGHCRSSVIEEVGEIDGIERVEVDLSSGTLEVHGVGIDPTAIGSAVAEAGYSLENELR